MTIERAGDELPPLPTGERVAGAKRRSGEGAAARAFVILGRSAAKRRADPGILAVTSVEGQKRSRISDWQCAARRAMFSTAVALGSNGMDPRVFAASLRSLLRPRMTKRWGATANRQGMRAHPTSVPRT